MDMCCKGLFLQEEQYPQTSLEVVYGLWLAWASAETCICAVKVKRTKMIRLCHELQPPGTFAAPGRLPGYTLRSCSVT